MLLNMCFVDLQRTQNSVDREWNMLAGVGIPAEMTAVIRQVHDKMRARVRVDDGELSELFPVTEDLRQGCVLSPLPLNILFTATLEVTIVRFSKDDIILQTLVHMLEETGMEAGNQPTKSRGRCEDRCKLMTSALCRGPPTDWRG